MDLWHEMKMNSREVELWSPFFLIIVLGLQNALRILNLSQCNC